MFHKNAFHRSFLLVLVIFIGGSNLCLAGNICSDQYSQDMDEDHITNQLNHVQDYISSDSLEQALILLESAKKFIDDGDPLMVNWYYYSGHIYQKQNKKSEALGMLKKSYNKAVQINLSDSVLFAKINSKLGKAYLDLSDSKNAFNHHFISLKIWKSDTARFHRDLIKNYNLIAEVYDMLYKLDSAKIYLDSAMTIMSNYGINSNKITTSLYTNLIINFLKTGKRDTAYHYIRKNISISKRYTKDKDCEARMYNILGLIHLHKSDFDSAVYFFKRNISINDSVHGKYHILSAASRDNLGNTYSSIADLDSASKYYNEALNIGLNELPEDDPKIASSYVNIGNLFWNSLQLYKAKEYYNKATNIYLKKYGPNHYQTQRAFSNKCTCLNNLKKYDEALECLKKALEMRYSNTTLLNLGVTYSNLGKYDSAIYFVSKALEERIKDKSHLTPKVASGYQQLGLVCKKAKDTLNAILNYNNSSEIYEQIYGPKHIEIARNYDDIGNIYKSLHNYDKAIKYYHRGLIAIAFGFENRDLTSYPMKSEYRIIHDLTYLSLLRKKADVFYQKYVNQSNNNLDLYTALELYGECLKLIPDVTREYKNLITRTKMFDIFNSVYINSIGAISLLNSKSHVINFYDTIFQIAESSKAQLLFESIRESIALSLPGIDKEIVKQERSIGQKINLTKSKLNKILQQPTRYDSIEVEELENMLFDLNFKYSKIKNKIETEYSEYYNLKYKTEVAGISDIKEVLSPNQAIIEYVMGDSTLFIFGITENETTFDVVKLDSNFTNMIDEFRSSYVNSGKEKPNLQRFILNSHYLYSKLIEPYEGTLQNKELIIIPDKELWYIPFEILVSDADTTAYSKFSELPLLIKQHPVSYVNSATIYLHTIKKKREKQKADLISFAPFSSEEDHQISNNNLVMLREMGVQDLALFGATEEVKSIHQYFKGNNYFDNLATESRFWDASNNYNIIHIASHGIIDDDKPTYSKLLFHSNEEDTINDGEVHTFELFNKQLNAQLVVLSACNTGMGKISKGEGVMSMARGFLYTGVPSVIMTLWSIDDQSSADLMKYFYQNLHDGKAKNIALQQAKLEYLKNVKNPNKIHPRFWAGYVLIGDPDPLNRNNQTKIILIVFSALIVSIAVILILRRKRNKKFS